MRARSFLLLFFILGLSSGYGYPVSAESAPDYDPGKQLSIDSGAYITSFITHYECNTTGKFTHEYHPFLLEKTGNSFGQLEERFKTEGMSLSGRIMLMGYEEQGVPRYYTDYKESQFTDEMATKTDAGWSLKMYNRFGLLTGFLFKDIDDISGVNGPVIEHINPQLVEIYDGRGTIFQEHAFGDAFHPVLRYQEVIERAVYSHRFDAVCQGLIDFWQTLYSNELKISGKEHVVGTQDILFSIAYMKHLQKSEAPITKFYMGPDITYPIEQSMAHNKEVTRHAQSFVKKMARQLVPVNNQKTVYVFCSFVDGVGKSTMLGNIKNWMEHKDDVSAYNHVDNSSSQLAEIFQFDTNVYIADLPAQVSHFTYKPDGYVYVDHQATKDDQNLQDRVREYAIAHQEELRGQFKAGGQACDQEFIDNLKLLKKTEKNQWVSFTFEEKQYLFHTDAPQMIRVRVPIADAPSHGLKNIYPEQMIFTLGVRFPLSYDVFVQDLIDRLHDQGVQNVVMVDFMSMYSRSSRENIRVNYLIQQIARLYKDFSYEQSFYQDFVNNAQLLAVLEKGNQRQKFTDGFIAESVVRLALYKILVNSAAHSIAGISLAEVTELVKTEVEQMSLSEKKLITQLSKKKLAREREGLQYAYGRSREFVTIQNFSLTDLEIYFKKTIHPLFDQYITDSEISRLWEKFNHATCLKSNSLYIDPMFGDQEGMLDNGSRVRVIARLNENCRDRTVLEPILKEIRAAWYGSLSNILFAEDSSESISGLDDFELGTKLNVRTLWAVPPLGIFRDDENNICVVTPHLDVIEKEYEQPDYSIFDMKPGEDPEFWSTFEERLFLTRWGTVNGTDKGPFAFGHEPTDKKGKKEEEQSSMWGDDEMFTMYGKPLVTKIYNEYQKEFGEQNIMPTRYLYEQLTGGSWRDKAARAHGEFVRKARAGGYFTDQSDVPVARQKSHWSGSNENEKFFLGDDRRRRGAQLFVRAIATLDMICKDLKTDIAVRRGHKKDFASALFLLETVTLPDQYSYFFDRPLFDDYDDVEPTISWDDL